MLTKGNPFDPDQMPILDRLHNTWGHENGYNGSNNGGQDGTDKLIVILRDGNELEGTCGYVRPDDTLKSRNQSLYSNQGEIIYINTDLLLNEETLGDIFCTCAHELKHLISVNMKKFRDGQNNGYWLKNEETSLEEGTACFSELICGFGLNYRDLSSTYSNLDNLMKYDARMSLGYCQDFFNDHNSFSIKNHDGSGKSYGGDYAFISYIYDRFGLNTIKDFAQNNPYTLNLNDEYELLAKIVSNNCGQNLSFYDLYSDFGKACLLNSKSSFVPDTFKMTTIKPSKLYQYIAEDNTTISNYFMPTVNISTMGTDNIIPWSLNYYATPNMTYSTGVTSSIFGLWGGLTNTFKMMLFDSSYKYESDIN